MRINKLTTEVIGTKVVLTLDFGKGKTKVIEMEQGTVGAFGLVNALATQVQAEKISIMIFDLIVLHLRTIGAYT